jgi:small GTP-binding protein
MNNADLLAIIAQAEQEGWTELDLSEHDLEVLPSEIGRLQSLKKLILGKRDDEGREKGNRFTAIPQEIFQLINLKELHTPYNQITAIPDAIAKLVNLTRLDLSDNQITAIPDAIANLANLTEIDISGNQITLIPDVIANLANLTEISFRNNQITAIPDTIAQLSNLTTLFLNNNQIKVIPDSISNLANLTRLYLGGNKITTIPDWISNLANLTSISLWSNQITAIPDAIAQLSNLTELNLRGNQITAIPDAIAQLSNLTTLYLNSNKITAIPDAIAQLSNLTTLSLDSNQITAIPDAIAQLSNLTTLRLDGNPLPIPVEILKDYKNPTAIFDFWAERERKPLNEAKVILVGQGTVGKTSLVKRLLDNQFDAAERKTEGISIRDWQVKAKKEQVKLRVWDFGGQEIMHATHQFFLTERSLYLLVINTREDERANKIEYWLKLIETLGQQAPVIIVGNKVDDHPLDLDERGLQNKYPNIKAFIGTSCLNGRGISELKKKIVEIIAEQMPHVFDPIPVSWLALKNQLEQDDRDYITFEQYEQKCIDEGITKESSRHTLVRLLHELGIVLNFSDDPRFRRLKDTNVLNPEWVTVGAYKVINDNLLMTKHKGVLYWQDSARVFQPKSRKEEDCYNTPETRKFILDMMEKFELCFPMDNSSDRDYPDYLIPDILPKEEPDTGKWDDCLNFEYHYDKVLPNSVISRFIVKARRHIDRSLKPTYWRTGVILASKDGNKAYVKADLEDAKIFVRISGNISTRRIFLSIIRDIFDEIHEKPVLTVSENVALPDNPKITVPYEDLCDLERDGTLDFKPYGTRQRYEVRALLDGIETTNERSDRLTKYEQIPRNRQRMDTPPPTPPKRNPWTSGSFFLVALVVITAAFAIISTYVPWYAFPIILIAAILAVGIVGALQLRNDEGLAETNFMTLMIETYKRLPLLKQDKSPK